MRLNRAGDVLLRMDGKRDVLLGKPHIYQQSLKGGAKSRRIMCLARETASRLH